jgi:hypothetical protein
MTNMLSDWAKEFLREDHVAVVSTLNKDGSSHLTVISQIIWRGIVAHLFWHCSEVMQ